MERSLPIGRNHSHRLRGRNSAHSPSIPLLSKPAPLTSLSPCLLASTIWSIFCLHASCSLKSPPWPPNSCLLSAPADNPSHHAKTHVAHKQRPTPNPQNPPTYLNHFSGNRLLGCVEEGRDGNTWRGRENNWGVKSMYSQEEHATAAASVWNCSAYGASRPRGAVHLLK